MTNGSSPQSTPTAQAEPQNATFPAEAFLPSVQFNKFGNVGDESALTGAHVTVVQGPRESPPAVTSAEVPLLAIPLPYVAPPGLPLAVVVAAEGHDHFLAAQIQRLLNPAATRVDLIHVTWLPHIISTADASRDIDNPEATELLAFEGAPEALVTTADALQAAGFQVSAHLRHDRQPVEALKRYVASKPPALIVVGLHRHGEGIGRVLMRATGRPVLFVEAREARG
jgi:hypothetical protein